MTHIAILGTATHCCMVIGGILYDNCHTCDCQSLMSGDWSNLCHIHDCQSLQGSDWLHQWSFLTIGHGWQ